MYQDYTREYCTMRDEIIETDLIMKETASLEGIVETAIDVLASVGFAQFSGLKVAKAHGISQSHLTYYFPTREDLLAAISEKLTDRCSQHIEKWCQEAKKMPGDPLAHLIDNLVTDAITPPTSILFPALWEAANQDSNMAEALDKIYQSAQARLIKMLGVNPNTPDAQPLLHLIRVLSVTIEGCTAVYGRQPADCPEIKQLQETIKQLLLPAFQKVLAAIDK